MQDLPLYRFLSFCCNRCLGNFMLSWCTWWRGTRWRGTPIKPEESVFQACEALAIFRDLRDAEGEEWRCGGDCGSQEFVLIKRRFSCHNSTSNLCIYIHIYIYMIMQLYVHVTYWNIYIINTQLLYTLYDAVCISYHWSVHGILSRGYMSYHICGIFATDK